MVKNKEVIPVSVVRRSGEMNVLCGESTAVRCHV